MRSFWAAALVLVGAFSACSNDGTSVGEVCAPGENPDPCFVSGFSCEPDYTDTSPFGGYCEVPTELFECVASVGCASGLSCVGGDGGLCLAACATSADCWDPMTTCQDAGSGLFCEPTPCADVWQPCAATDPDGGDGTCVLIAETSSGPLTACLQGGGVLDGGSCNYYRGLDAGLCVPGSVCITQLNGSNVGICMTACDPTIGADGGPACGGGCTFATPPAPPPGLSELDFFSRAGGCAALCTSAEAGSDAGCPGETGCVDTGEPAAIEFQCLP
jgi:hypothetical protein